MARIAGVDLPNEKRVEYGLTYVYGIGVASSRKILEEAGINPDTRVKDLTEDEEKKIREKAFAGYQVNSELMSVAKKDAMVLHCLPAHREEEITAEVFEAHANEIFEEAENRLHAQKAVLVTVMKD